VAITGAAGIYGSSITAYKIEVAGQTINAVSGTTTALGQNGSLTLRGTVTDSRGKTAVKDITISVLNYLVPAITASSAVRSTVGGTVDPNGTYIKVNITAVVQSLVVGTQKNNLTYKIRTKDKDDLTPWASVTPVKSASAGSTGYSDDNIFGTYSVSNSYIVRIEITDNLGSVSAQELVVSTGGTLIHLSNTADGFGVGKYWEQGSIDALEAIYHKNGTLVADYPMVTARAGTAAPSTYPVGTSAFSVPADGSWPNNFAVVHTTRHGSNRSWQIIVAKTSGSAWIRAEGDGDTWGVWVALNTLTTAQINALADARIAANPAIVARLKKNTGQNTSSTAGAAAAIIWTSDSGGSGLWSSGTPTRVRLNRLGWWRVRSHLRFLSNTGYGTVNKNGVINDESQSLIPYLSGIGSYAIPGDLIECTNAATDYVETLCYSVIASNQITFQNCHMEVEYLGL